MKNVDLKNVIEKFIDEKRIKRKTAYCFICCYGNKSKCPHCKDEKTCNLVLQYLKGNGGSM